MATSATSSVAWFENVWRILPFSTVVLFGFTSSLAKRDPRRRSGAGGESLKGSGATGDAGAAPPASMLKMLFLRRGGGAPSAAAPGVDRVWDARRRSLDREPRRFAPAAGGAAAAAAPSSPLPKNLESDDRRRLDAVGAAAGAAPPSFLAKNLDRDVRRWLPRGGPAGASASSAAFFAKNLEMDDRRAPSRFAPPWRWRCAGFAGAGSSGAPSRSARCDSRRKDLWSRRAATACDWSSIF